MNIEQEIIDDVLKRFDESDQSTNYYVVWLNNHYDVKTVKNAIVEFKKQRPDLQPCFTSFLDVQYGIQISNPKFQ